MNDRPPLSDTALGIDRPDADTIREESSRLPVGVAFPLILAMSLASWGAMLWLAFGIGERLV